MQYFYLDKEALIDVSFFPIIRKVWKLNGIILLTSIEEALNGAGAVRRKLFSLPVVLGEGPFVLGEGPLGDCL